MSDWIRKTAVEQIAGLKKREISATELLSQTIAHTKSVVHEINPIALELYDRAEIAAADADYLLKKGKGGPLCGLPITVKDSQWLAGERCANGSQSLAEFVPDQTCMAIERLENAGAVVFAKTTCPEFCLSGTNNSPLYGATYNPWNLTKTPGGSSGGAAAAVSAGIGSLSLGGDGGGSIRIPAAFCGVVGFKPSYGVVPRRPGFTTWESLVAYGPVSRSVADARLMFSVLADLKVDQTKSNRAEQEEIRIIASENLGFAPVEHDVRDAFAIAVEKIRRGGMPLKFGHPNLKSSVTTWATVATSDMWQHKGDIRSTQYVTPESMGVYAQEFIKFGKRFRKENIDDAQAHRVMIHDAYVELFKSRNANVLVTPTLGCEAFHHSQTFPQQIQDTPITYPWLDWAGFLYDANLAGMPACSIPMGLGNEGLPLSLQVSGLPGDDLLVLQAAEQIEKLLGWAHQIAPRYEINNLQPGLPPLVQQQPSEAGAKTP